MRERVSGPRGVRNLRAENVDTAIRLAMLDPSGTFDVPQ